MHLENSVLVLLMVQLDSAVVELQLVMCLMPQCLAIHVRLLVKDVMTMLILVRDLRTTLLRDPRIIATQVVICKLYYLLNYIFIIFRYLSCA